MPSRTTKIVAAAIAASTLTSSFLPSDGFMPSFRTSVFRRVDPTSTRLNYVDTPADPPLPGLSPPQQLEHTLWIQIHSYLVSIFQDYREWPEIIQAMASPSESDVRKFNVEPKAVFAQATYRYSVASPEIKAALERECPQVLSEWKIAVSNYYALLLPAEPSVHPMMQMSIMSMLYLKSQEVVSKLKHHYRGSFSEDIHPQQWLVLQDRFQYLFTVDHHRKGPLMPLVAYGNRITPFWNVRAPGFTKSFTTDPDISLVLQRYNELAKALISGQTLSPEQMIEHDFLMTKLVFIAEPWLNDQKDHNLARFDTPQDYTQPKKDQPKQKPSLFRFEPQEYGAPRPQTENSSSSSPMYTFEHTSETNQK